MVILVECKLVGMKRPPDAGVILQGTLDMLILRTLVMGAAHGHTIAEVIEHTSENALEVEQGSLYPALYRLEDHWRFIERRGICRSSPAACSSSRLSWTPKAIDGWNQQ